MVEKTYPNVTPERFAAIQESAEKSLGFPITGDSGQASKSGITVNWNYNRQTGDLVLQCPHHPLLVLGSLIIDKFDQLVQGA